ncbi:MAG: hypothetical protein M0R80_20500 [Proteobacteria bacterium]|jgi:hypothetical protein|nr:hypothetical protein [Pseudomonadota bacterium]
MRCTVYLLPLFVLAACSGGGSSSPDAGSDAGDTDTGDPVPLTAVDLLMVLNDSNSIPNEQVMLSQNLYAMISALLSPLPSSGFAAVNDLRVAAVTANMGISSNGVNNDAYWPQELSSCAGFGRNGEFQPVQASSITLPNDTIACDASGSQCPFGWTCVVETDAGVDAIGVCHTDGSTTVSCPQLEDTVWAQTSPGAPNTNFRAQAACLAVQGANGCGPFWQELQAAATSLTREDQADFVRADAVLAVIALSDEDDCSMQDGQALFAEDELADSSLGEIWLACERHPEHLLPPSHFYDVLTGMKPSADAVVYAAIAGVPWAGEDPEGAAACEGSGDQIGSCLDQEAMQLEPVGEILHWRPGCTRQIESVIMEAAPARRFVELATDFGANGYVYSICNED